MSGKFHIFPENFGKFPMYFSGKFSDIFPHLECYSIKTLNVLAIHHNVYNHSLPAALLSSE